MANRILKGLAVAAGTGLAMGFSSGRARVRAFAPLPGAAAPVPASDLPPDSYPDDEFLDIEPLLDRLERLEGRIESIERQPAARSIPEARDAIADLDRRVEENTRALTLLREHVTEAERRATESMTSVQRQTDRTREEIPALVEKSVSARIDDLQSRFGIEIEQMHRRTLETFERTIDEKISSRISSIEHSLAEQAGSIEALRARAAETDSNLQRLVSAIEKLCERAQLVEPALAQRPEARLPFESQLHDAMEREPVIPVFKREDPDLTAPAPVPAFAESGPKKSRFLFRSLFLIAVGLSLHASRFVAF